MAGKKKTVAESDDKSQSTTVSKTAHKTIAERAAPEASVSKPAPKSRATPKAKAKPKTKSKSATKSKVSAKPKLKLAAKQTAAKSINTETTAKPGASEKTEKPKSTEAPKSASKKQTSTLADLLKQPANAEKFMRLSQNLSTVTKETQKLAKYVGGQNKNARTVGDAADPFGAMEAWGKVGMSIASQPNKLVEAQVSFWKGQMEIMSSMMPGAPKKASSDRRFSDEDWDSNPYFNFLRTAYEVNTNWIMSLIDMSEGLTPHERQKVNFFAKQMTDAMSPTNSFATNPAAIKAMLETGGESVLEGMTLLRQDFEKGDGELSITQVDETPFVLGETIATAPGKVVFRNDLIEVLQYEPTTKTVFERPLIFFPPWINKFYILDLQEKNSMIRWLVDKGFSIFVVSWRSADDVTKDYDWDDYVTEGGFAAIDAVREICGVEDVNAVGYCIGGTMLTSALGYMNKRGDYRVNAATYFASQADFTEAGDLLVFSDDAAYKVITKAIEDNDGIMPGEVMAETFNYMRPNDLVWRYVVDSYMLGKKPKAFDLLYWNADQTNLPGPTHRRYLSNLYRHNELSEGGFKVLDDVVTIADVDIPVLLQAGREDHIAPARSIYKAAVKYGGDTEFVLAGSGHIAGVINHPDAQKYQYWTNDHLPGSFDEWVETAQESPGSWWPYWRKWLAGHSGKRVPSKPVQDMGMGDAPGTYAKIRLEDIAKSR